MKSFCYTIRDSNGIHARPACQLAKLISSFTHTTITIIKEQNRADASQLLDVMGLCIKKGDNIMIEISGEQEEACFASIKDFFENYL